MNCISKHDVNKLSIAELRTLLPFEVMSDGEVVFVAYDVNRLKENTPAQSKASHDVNILKGQPEAKHDVNKLSDEYVVVGGVRFRKHQG